MKNHGLGTHNEKMCAEISTGKTPSTPQLIRPIGHKQPIIWDTLHCKIIKGMIL